MIINIKELCGSFAENKDMAKEIRENKIKPELNDTPNKVGSIVLDFEGVDSSTQSFIHALISGFFQKYKMKALRYFKFKGCNKAIKSLITAVINYSLE